MVVFLSFRQNYIKGYAGGIKILLTIALFIGMSLASQLIVEVIAHAQRNSHEDARGICADGTYFPNNRRNKGGSISERLVEILCR
jgi:hypothetical protein